MGCDCCKGRPGEFPPSLPAKKEPASRLEGTEERLVQDLASLRQQLSRPKLSSRPDLLWSSSDFSAYSVFLTSLASQAEALQQNPLLQSLSLPIDRRNQTENRQKASEMQEFIHNLRDLHEPGELPDAFWLEAVKQLVGKKSEINAQKQLFDRLSQKILSKTVASSQISALQVEITALFDGFFLIIQLTERIFRAISFLSRVALVMQTRIDEINAFEMSPETRIEVKTEV